MRCCTFPPPEGEWRDIYDDPVRPRRTGYECPPDFLQIGAWTVIIVLAVLHYMIQIPFMEGTLFIVVLVITSVLVAGVFGTKITLELYQQEDAVVFAADLPRLPEEELQEENAPPGTTPCVFCRRFVTENCKHCSVCDKCVPGFDHHCRWLNSCVGAKNYKLFATFMGFAWVSMAWIVAISLYTIVDCLHDVEKFKTKMQSRAYHSSRNAFPAIVVFNFIALSLSVAGCFALGKLITFHIYLHCTHQTTYEHILKKRAKKRAAAALKEQSQRGANESKKKEDDGWCALRKRRDFKKHSKKPDTGANNNHTSEHVPTEMNDRDAGATAVGSGTAATANAYPQADSEYPSESRVGAHSPDSFASSYIPSQRASQRGTDSIFDRREPFEVDLNM